MPNTSWNRSGRRSGGARAKRIRTEGLTLEEVAIVVQRAKIRQEVGEQGVQRDDEALPRKVAKTVADKG